MILAGLASGLLILSDMDVRNMPKKAVVKYPLAKVLYIEVVAHRATL